MTASAKKNVQTLHLTTEQLVSDAMGEFQALRDELGEWADNLEGANMSHLPKYEEVEETRDNLEQFCDDEPELPEEFKKETITITRRISKKRQSRSDRRSDACSNLNLVGQLAEEKRDAAKEGSEEWDAFNEVAEAIRNVIDEAENVSFPGMY